MSAQTETNGPRVLVVEDDEQIAQLLQFMLAREGFEVLHAAEGRTAAAMLGDMAPPELVLLDVMLPHVDGFQLIQLIRSSPDWVKVPVVMLTAKSQERDIVRALEAGADDYVVKPFQPLELTARLKRLLKPGK